MPTLQEQLQTAVDQTTADSNLFHNIVHGDTLTEVVTENGNVKSVAKVVAENEQTLTDSIATLTAMRDQSVNSAIAAAQSETNAANSETNTALSEAKALAAVGAVADKYIFDDAVVMEDPTSGVIRFDNSNLSLAGNIAISAQTSETAGPDISAFINTWGASTSLIKGIVTIKKSGAPDSFALFAVTGAVADNGTWLQVPITYITGNGAFALSDDLYISFSRTGDKGDGDLVAANNLSDLTNIPTARDNLGLGTAALKNTGTGVGNIPELEAGGKLPAVDGSQLLNLPGIPAGTIIDYAGNSVPSGYLTCDGAGVSRTTYANLFAAIGTLWGIGDGSTTFNLPNLSRRTTVGSGGTGTATIGNVVGNTGGSETHTLSTDEIPAHNHTYTNATGASGGGAAGRTIGASATYTTSNTGGGQSHNNMQPSAVVLKIIKT